MPGHAQGFVDFQTASVPRLRFGDQIHASLFLAGRLAQIAFGGVILQPGEVLVAD